MIIWFYPRLNCKDDLEIEADDGYDENDDDSDDHRDNNDKSDDDNDYDGDNDKAEVIDLSR